MRRAARRGCAAAGHLHARPAHAPGPRPGSQVPRETGGDGDAEPTELAIGKPGGFASAQGPLFDVVREHALVVMPSRTRVALPNPDLPELVLQAISAIQVHGGGAGDWDWVGGLGIDGFLGGL